MRIDYDVTEDEYVEASLASQSKALPPTTPLRRRSRRALLVVGITFIASMVLLASSLWLRDAYAAFASDGWPGVFERVGRIEWLLPYLAWSVVVTTISIAAPRGRTTLRIASCVLVVLLTTTVVLVVTTATLSTRPMMLDGFGIFRAMPWVLSIAAVVTLLDRVWTNRVIRRAFAASPYAAGMQTLTLDDDAARCDLPTVSVIWRWPAFFAVRKSPHTVMLCNRAGHAMVIVPRRAIGDAAAVDELVAVLESRVGAASVGFAVDARVRSSSLTPG